MRLGFGLALTSLRQLAKIVGFLFSGTTGTGGDSMRVAVEYRPSFLGSMDGAPAMDVAVTFQSGTLA